MTPGRSAHISAVILAGGMYRITDPVQFADAVTSMCDLRAAASIGSGYACDRNGYRLVSDVPEES